MRIWKWPAEYHKILITEANSKFTVLKMDRLWRMFYHSKVVPPFHVLSIFVGSLSWDSILFFWARLSIVLDVESLVVGVDDEGQPGKKINTWFQKTVIQSHVVIKLLWKPRGDQSVIYTTWLNSITYPFPTLHPSYLCSEREPRSTCTRWRWPKSGMNTTW